MWRGVSEILDTLAASVGDNVRCRETRAAIRPAEVQTLYLLAY
jgi:hypothetical protein